VYVVGVLLLIIEALTAVIEPYPIAYVIDFLQGARPSLRALGWPTLVTSELVETLILLTVAIVAIAAVNSAADSLTEVCMARGGRSLGYRIRVAMYSHLQRLSLSYHDKKRTGDVLTRVTGDVLVVEEFVVQSVSNILGSLLVLVGSLSLMFYQSWNVALIALGIVPLLALISNYYSRRIKTASKTQRSREGELASTAQEMLTSIRLVQSYGRGRVDVEQFSSQTEKSMRASLRAANIQAQFSFVVAIMEALAICAVVWLGVWLVGSATITIGTLVLFVMLLQNMFKPARKIVSEWYKIGKVFASVERIDDLLDREVVVQDEPDALTAPVLTGRLRFDHVSFTYPAEHEDGSEASRRPKVLHDIDFEVAPGEVVSLVGSSGAGKSTIAQLVPRLYNAEEGAVLVDGINVRRLTLSSLRSQVSLVLQDTVLLNGTVAENIGYGIADSTPERIEAAAQMANAHSFIMAMPDGYDTQLGERGAMLSGGQRQRIAIARAFIRETPILILDEPTTGLDLESTQLVLTALRSLMRGKTTIIISHDPGLIRCADRILVIADGRIAESGEHNELMSARGLYAELYVRELDTEIPHTNGNRNVNGIGSGGAGWHRPDSDDAAVAPERSESVTVLRDSQVPTVRHRVANDRLSMTNGYGGAGALLPPLAARVPNLASALNSELTARRIERSLLWPGGQVHLVTPGVLSYQPDGSCSLRYRVSVSVGTAEVSEHTVLARVHPSKEVGGRSLFTEASGLAPLTDPPVPWRRWTTEDSGEVPLYLFPADPALPTLATAMNLAALQGEDWPSRSALPVSVNPVHYGRQGASVLRYGVRRTDSSATWASGHVYGKVYPDRTTGETVHHFLESCGNPGRAHIPIPLGYSPRLHLGLTEALPGRPTLASIVRSAARVGVGPPVTPPGGSAHEAVRSTGRTLAALHNTPQATAPVRTIRQFIGELDKELKVVEQVWPRTADYVRSIMDPVGTDSDGAARALCHGDFTPSQVLLAGDTVCGIVDFDTVCWSDPAMDLGRFLAHLDLLVTKECGQSAEPIRKQLADSFVSGYSDSAGVSVMDRQFLDRIARFRSLSLASTALHACRQLKERRLSLALSLLSTANYRTEMINS